MGLAVVSENFWLKAEIQSDVRFPVVAPAASFQNTSLAGRQNRLVLSFLTLRASELVPS
jgi:hypothetical protein